jgi:hypothetical protein
MSSCEPLVRRVSSRRSFCRSVFWGGPEMAGRVPHRQELFSGSGSILTGEKAISIHQTAFQDVAFMEADIVPRTAIRAAPWACTFVEPEWKRTRQLSRIGGDPAFLEVVWFISVGFSRVHRQGSLSRPREGDATSAEPPTKRRPIFLPKGSDCILPRWMTPTELFSSGTPTDWPR